MRNLIIVSFVSLFVSHCKPAANYNESSDVAGAVNSGPDAWKVNSGSNLSLEAANETYFKNSLDMVRIKDASGAIRLNPNYNGSKCGIRAGTKVTFKFVQTLTSNPKYAIGEIVSIENASKYTFDFTSGFCSPGHQGFVFKSDFKVIVTTNEKAQDPTKQNPSVESTPTTDSKPSITGLPQNAQHAVTPNDDYIISRSNSYNALLKAEGDVTHLTMNLRRIVYSIDGRVRIAGSFAKMINFFPSATDSKKLDLTPKIFTDWEDKSSRRLLVPLAANEFANADWCEFRNLDEKIERYEYGRGISPCPAPMNETGVSWIWVDCDDLVRTQFQCSN